MKPGMKHLKSTACAIGTVLSMLARSTTRSNIPIQPPPPKFPAPPPVTR